ncbi:MAG TPA: recombination protein RecR [Candidatus Wirthbacteria bacterium]|nr:recombination protein RecR [Candidatus Wirthbacteria bacterium]
MSILPAAIENLIEEFSRLPGIGPKSASRLTFYLLKSSRLQSQTLSEAIGGLHVKLVYCQICHNIAEQSPCQICANPRRDQSKICVVSEPLDVLAIEKTANFKGLYHVLHGTISPIDGVGPEDLKIQPLINRLKKSAINPEQMEIILSTNPTLEGETTAMYLAKLLQPLGASITRIARGLPVGGDLEYADETTLSNALQNRQVYLK